MLLLLAVYLACPMGCASAPPEAPEAWSGSRLPITDATAFDGPTSALQVLICHGQVHGTHTGLRLLRENQETIFWDPAGAYGKNRDDLHRRRDVFVSGAPGMAEYVRWRFDGAEDSAVSLFEWRLSPERAAYFAGILTGTAEAPQGQEAFDTTTIGLFCCRAVCEFLDRFARDEMSIPKYWFRPEHLAEHLWTQDPDRVGIFRDDGSIELLEAASR